MIPPDIPIEGNEKYYKLRKYLDIAFWVCILLIIASCTKEVDSVTGYQRNQKVANVIFLHIFLFFPCLFSLVVYMQLKLEKKYVSQETLKKRDDLMKRQARKSLRNKYGILSQILGMFIKPSEKDKD